MNFTLTGTTGTTFTGVKQHAAGAVGYRDIGGGQFRVRVAPANGKALDLPGWKTPFNEGSSESFNRYSTVVTGVAALVAAVSQGQAALAVESVAITATLQ